MRYLLVLAYVVIAVQEQKNRPTILGSEIQVSNAENKVRSPHGAGGLFEESICINGAAHLSGSSGERICEPTDDRTLANGPPETDTEVKLELSNGTEASPEETNDTGYFRWVWGSPRSVSAKRAPGEPGVKIPKPKLLTPKEVAAVHNHKADFISATHLLANTVIVAVTFFFVNAPSIELRSLTWGMLDATRAVFL